MQQKVQVILRDFPDIKPFEVEFDPSQVFQFIKSKIAQKQQKIPEKQLVCVLENIPTKSLKENESNQRQKVTPNCKILAIHVDHLLDPNNLLRSKTTMRQDAYQIEDSQSKLEELQNTQLLERQKYDDQISRLRNKIQDLEYAQFQQEENYKQQLNELEGKLIQQQANHEEEIDHIKMSDNQFKEQLTNKVKMQFQENNSLKKQINEYQEKIQEMKEKNYEYSREKEYIQEECDRYKRQLVDTINKTGKIQEVDFMKIKNELDLEKQKSQKLEISLKALQAERAVLKNKISDLETQYNEINQEFQRLLLQNQRDKDDHKIKTNQLENEISDLKRNIEAKLREISKLNELKTNQNTQLIELNANYHNLETKKERLQQENNDKDIKIVQLELKLKGLQENKATTEDQWSKQHIEHQEQISKHATDIQKQKKEIQLLKQHESELENQILGYQKNIKDEILKNQRLSDEYTKLSESSEKQIREKQTKIDIMEERKNKLIARIKNNQGKSKLMRGVTSAVFELFKINQDISTFLTGDNSMTDIQEYTIQKIIPRKQVLEQKINKLSDLDFNDAFELENPPGKITCKFSLQPNASGSNSKVQVLQDENTKQFYIIKDSIKQQNDQSISQLQQFFLPTLIAEFLLDKFVEALKKCDAEKQPYKFRFQEQFIFQSGTKYFYAQKIGQVDKFILYNGKQNNQPDIKVCQYLNAFTIFSLKYSQNQMMVDNLQGSSDTLYDPIINTDDGLFNEEDQGQDRIDELLRNAKDDPKFHGKQLLTSLSIKI